MWEKGTEEEIGKWYQKNTELVDIIMCKIKEKSTGKKTCLSYPSNHANDGCGESVFLPVDFSFLEETCNKNLQSNEDKNAATKNAGFVCQLCAGFLSDAESCIADKEGNDTNQ